MFKTDYCGYNVHNPDRDTIYRPLGRGDYLFLHITCEMDFYFNNKKSDTSFYERSTSAKNQERTHSKEGEVVYRDGSEFIKKDAHPGDCIIFTPGELQFYQAKKRFSNSFVHFTCENDEISGIQIPMNKLFHPSDDENIVEILRRLQVEYLSKKIRRERMIDLLIKELLIESERGLFVSEEESSQPGIYAELGRFRIHMLQHCSDEWTIEKMCDMTHLGRSQLYHYYKSFFYISPKEDLIKARIDKAKHLLTNQELRVSEVAEQSGFQNIYHFNRYFKKECGITPGKFRNN